MSLETVDYKEGLKVSFWYDDFEYVIGVLAQDKRGDWWVCQNALQELDKYDNIFNNGGFRNGYVWSCRLCPEITETLCIYK